MSERIGDFDSQRTTREPIHATGRRFERQILQSRTLPSLDIPFLFAQHQFAVAVSIYPMIDLLSDGIGLGSKRSEPEPNRTTSEPVRKKAGTGTANHRDFEPV